MKTNIFIQIIPWLWLKIKLIQCLWWKYLFSSMNLKNIKNNIRFIIRNAIFFIFQVSEPWENMYQTILLRAYRNLFFWDLFFLWDLLNCWEFLGFNNCVSISAHPQCGHACMHWIVSIFSTTHTAGMHSYTEKFCEIYPTMHRNLLKNPNKSQKNKSRYLLLF